MEGNIAPHLNLVKRKFKRRAHSPQSAAGHNASMPPYRMTDKANPRRNPYYFRAWRLHRGMTQAELAERVDLAVPTISQIESGRTGLTLATLERLAAALECDPGDLLATEPGTRNVVAEVWRAIPDEDKDQALLVLRAFARSPGPPSSAAT